MAFDQIFYSAIIGAWIGGVIIYFFYYRKVWLKKKREAGERRSKRKIGKRCPQCKNIINYQRTVCHHCGYPFPPVPEHKSHTRSGSRKKKRGKKCPQCGNVINTRREVCQHCGYTFEADKAKPESGEKSEPDQNAAN